MSDYAKFIREKRKERGYSREELAAAAGITSMTVLRIENGHNEPNLKTFQAMLYKLGYQIELVPAQGIEGGG